MTSVTVPSGFTPGVAGEHKFCPMLWLCLLWSQENHDRRRKARLLGQWNQMIALYWYSLPCSNSSPPRYAQCFWILTRRSQNYPAPNYYDENGCSVKRTLSLPQFCSHVAPLGSPRTSGNTLHVSHSCVFPGQLPRIVSRSACVWAAGVKTMKTTKTFERPLHTPIPSCQPESCDEINHCWSALVPRTLNYLWLCLCRTGFGIRGIAYQWWCCVGFLGKQGTGGWFWWFWKTLRFEFVV